VELQALALDHDLCQHVDPPSGRLERALVEPTILEHHVSPDAPDSP